MKLFSKNKLRFKFIFLFFSLSTRVLSQDTNVNWIENIDTLDFKILYNKKYIPKELLNYLEIEKLSEIANPNKPYKSSCVSKKELPRMRLNWLAKDLRDHVIVSISIGGLVHRTLYFFLDKRLKKFNINELSFGYDSRELTLDKIVMRINNNSYEFEEFILPSTE